jgi:hypothetical protein
MADDVFPQGQHRLGRSSFSKMGIRLSEQIHSHVQARLTTMDFIL